MKKIKAIVSDFDGTLAKDGKITSNAKNAIKKYIEDGGLFSLATGRGYKGIIEQTIKKLGLSDLNIIRGGAEIISASSGKTVWGKYINANTVNRLIKFLKDKKDYYYAAESGNVIFTPGGKPDPEIGLNAEFKDISGISEAAVPKIFVVPGKYGNEKIDPLLTELSNEFNDIHIVKTSSSKGIGLDINDIGAGKRVSLNQYAKLCGIDSGLILGVGDSYNDYPLLVACGYKVAMGNAPRELTEIADKVVGNWENDGIVDAIDFARSTND